jgi:hypothetical protein
MDIKTELAAAGLQIIDGNIRVLAALGAGVDIEAIDELGATYRLSTKSGKLTVEKAEHQGQGPAAVIQFPSTIPMLPIQALTQDPSVGRQSTYSFRAETELDTTLFLSLVRSQGYAVASTVHSDADGLPDVDVEMQCSATLEQLQGILRTIKDAHLMLQTLRPVPLADNSLERDYELH